MPSDNINNRTATEEEIAFRRVGTAKALLRASQEKAATTDPEFKDDKTIQREIQAAKDIVRVEEQYYQNVINNVPVSTIKPNEAGLTLTFSGTVNISLGF